MVVRELLFLGLMDISHSTTSQIFLDGCFMRSENYSFFDEYAGPGDKAVCGNKTRTNLSFRAAAKQALLEVVQSAPNSIGYYARGKIDVSGSSSSCTKHQNLICEIGLQEKIDTILSIEIEARFCVLPCIRVQQS
ncbi:Cysteine-rich receptor-like protein kinase [Arachis hypogaea]|nr:Cysteine-rich receptor-like protein kinase [Arachis hypogaea]